jgi:hypothetical protein
MAQGYIQAVTDYANILKDDANTEGFPIVKKLMSAIKKAGITYFGETEKYINGPYKGQTKSGFVDTLTGDELDGTLYESDLGFDEDDNFIILNKNAFKKKLNGNQGSNNENKGSNNENEGSNNENEGSNNENKGSNNENEGSNNENEGSNSAWFSDAWGFSLLIDISDPKTPMFVANDKLKTSDEEGITHTTIQWKNTEGQLSIDDIVELSAANNYKIIGLTFEMEGVNMIWFPIPTAAAGGRRRRQKTRARRRRTTKKRSRK